MSETAWLALLAVVGTVLGAAISPVANALRDILTSRADAKSDRLSAAAELGIQMINFANINPDRYEGYLVRASHQDAVASRFALARHLPRGSGQVDRFVEFSIGEIAKYTAHGPRVAIAEYAAARVLDWARGDLRPKKLATFHVDRAGDEYLII
ncbi:hypothetical protein [Microbacterium sp.]|uniref:hypothetical protein n=1 Tax=Microbacterium sp. TaxID=51671 RepID=UPI0039E2BC2B